MIRLSQSNYNALNHHIEHKKCVSVTQEYINMRGKYYSSRLGKELTGDLYILWLYIYKYIQGQDQGQILTQPE